MFYSSLQVLEGEERRSDGEERAGEEAAQLDGGSADMAGGAGGGSAGGGLGIAPAVPAFRRDQQGDLRGQMTEEEAESVLRRKPCSGPKLKEMTGSGIFAADSEDGEEESGSASSAPTDQTSLRIYQQTVCAMSQISFSADEIVTPKKPTSIAEVAKQRELSGTLQSESEDKLKKQLSEAKCRELSGHDIFAPPREIDPQPLATQNSEMDKDIGESTPQSSHPPAKISNSAGKPSSFLFGEEPVVKTAKKIYTN